MRVLIDKHIPFLAGILDDIAEVHYLDETEFTQQTVQDADALMVRTRVKCDANLLKNSKVKFIATATIGYDHIDTHFCEQHGITWFASAGCNSQGVCDYVQEALEYLQESNHLPKKPTIGVVGYGNIGTKVAQMAEKKGFDVLLNDAPKQIGCSLEELAQKADVITFHVPFTKSGAYATYHLADKALFERCKASCVLINASRGGVMDEESLLNKGLDCIVDCWENEPNINLRLLQHSLLASYHIAGYTMAGKVTASRMCLEALCSFFNLPQPNVQWDYEGKGDSEKGWLYRVSQQLKNHPNDFELLRNNYILR